MARRGAARAAANQALVDFLARLQAATEPKAPRKALLIRRAQASVANVEHDLWTEDDMRKVHGIGSWLAQMLFRERCRVRDAAADADADVHVHVHDDTDEEDENAASAAGKRKASGDLQRGTSSLSSTSTSRASSKTASEAAAASKRRRGKGVRANTFAHSILQVLYLNREADEPLTLLRVAELVQRYRRAHGLSEPAADRVAQHLKSALETQGLVKRVRRAGIDVVEITESGRKLMAQDSAVILERQRSSLSDRAAYAPATSQSSSSSSSSSISSRPESQGLPSLPYVLPRSQDLDLDSEDEDDPRGQEPETGGPAPSAVGKAAGVGPASAYEQTLSTFTFTPNSGRAAVVPVPLAEQSAAQDASHEWELVLLVDNREGAGRDKTIFHSKLLEQGINVEVRSLSLGDALWIMRRKCADGTCEEFVSDFIIERKEVSDLGQSIKDGRYSEQKFRLRRCGLSRVMYLVEGEVARQAFLNPQALRTAMVETQVRDGFSVVHVFSVSETVNFLVRTHKLIASMTVSASTDAWSGPDRSKWRRYDVFSAANIKGKLRSVSEIFGAQIKQIKSFSGTRAASILEKYPTPRDLLELYDNELKHLPVDYKRTYLQNVEVPGHLRGLGPSCSTSLYEAFNHRVSST